MKGSFHLPFDQPEPGSADTELTLTARQPSALLHDPSALLTLARSV